MSNKFEKLDPNMLKKLTNKEETLPEELKKGVEIDLMSVITDDSKSLFEKLSDKGKEIAKKVYEGLYNNPVTNRLVAKLEIALNQKRIDVYEKKLSNFKSNLDRIDYCINIFNQSEKELSEYRENALKNNIPVEGIDKQLKRMRESREKLLLEKEKISPKFEMNKNKRDAYVEKRNIVAQRLIDYYQLKIDPLEKRKEILNQHKNDLENKWKKVYAKHEEQIMILEKQKNDLYQVLLKAGLSERKIKNDETIKEIEKMLRQEKKELVSEKAAVERQMMDVNKKLDKLNNNIYPYIQKRNEFVAVINRMPIDFAINEEKQAKEEKQENKIEEKEVMPEEKMSVREFLKYWLRFLEASSRKDKENYQFVESQFVEKAKTSLNDQIDMKKFVSLLKNFYKERPKEEKERINMLIEDFIVQLPKEKGE